MYKDKMFLGAQNISDDISSDVRLALHFEICPGGYWGTMLIVSDIGDDDAMMHYVDIRAGLPGQPAVFLASYRPEDISLALNAFFELGSGGKPLYYNGTSHFEVKSKADLIESLCEVLSSDDDDGNTANMQKIIAVCEGNATKSTEKYRSIQDVHREMLKEQ